MKKSILLLMGLLLFYSAYAVDVSGVPVQPKQTPTDVNVGIISPVTGDLSAYSAGFEHAAALAVSHLNADPDFAAFNFNLLATQDTQTTATGATAAFDAAVGLNAHFVVGAAGSSNTLAAADHAVTAEIPLISYASTSQELTVFEDNNTATGPGYLWRIPPSDELQGEVIAELAYQAGYDEMVIVNIQNSYGDGLANATGDAFIDKWGSDDVLLAIIAYDTATTVDYTALVASIAAEEPDIVVAISYGTDGSQLFVEMDTQNLDVQVIGADGVADVSIFGETTGTQAAMQGFLTTKPSGVASDEKTAFDTAYAAAYPADTGVIYTYETYDAVWAGALAVLAANSTVGEDIAEALADVSFAGASGSISFTDAGDRACVDVTCIYSIGEVQDDEIVEVATWDPINSVDYTSVDFLLDWKGRNPGTFSEGSVTPTSDTDGDGDDSPFPFVPAVVAFAVISFAAAYKRRKY